MEQNELTKEATSVYLIKSICQFIIIVIIIITRIENLNMSKIKIVFLVHT